ncbi:MAG: peroxidase family protein, partial [Chloroflexota bacterium]
DTARADERERDHEADVPPPGRFGRIFSQLPPFATASPAMRTALIDIGKAGGILDAKDDLSKGPVLLITDPNLSKNNPNNTTHTAGTTFLGQFIDHDLTFDLTSRLGVPRAPESSPNERTPAFDLDSVYGRGPLVDVQLYDPSDRRKLKVGFGGRFEDLPRAADQSAIIADPRNDEHIILSGLHAAILKFHNRAVDLVRSQGGSGDKDDDHDERFSRARQSRDDHDTVYRRARRLTAWHYQWIVVHELMPQLLGQPMVDDILRRGPRFFRTKEHGFIPVEFQGAAYRFGHSMVRPSYRANLQGNSDGSPFFGLVFDHGQNNKADPDDLRGGIRAPRRFIGWQTFFKFDDPALAAEVKPNKKIDTKISTPLMNLTPGTIAGAEQAPTALPQRNLLRHLTWGIPSGQAIARVMGVPSLSKTDLSELGGYSGQKLDESTPLWYYILKEAELMGNGEHLGPVGGRIVGEVFVGLLRADESSYLRVAPSWRPTLPSGVSGSFRMVDVLTFAQVDPRSRGQ